jgi:hypothetical protein
VQKAHKIIDVSRYLQVGVGLLVALMLFAAPRRRAVNPPTESPGTLTTIASMSEARAVHTSTLLPNGLVLIAGGFGDHSSSTAELYDPAQRTFRPTGSMSIARSEHRATLLPDGKVLITGGLDASSNTLQSTEIYDPATGRFTSGPPMTVSRSGHVTVTMQDGRILLTGGTIGTSSDWTFHSSAEIYDPATRRFTATGSMNVPRASHTMTLLPNGEVLVIGGHNGRHAAIQIYATAELYNPHSGTFRPTGAMARIRHKHDAALLRDGRVLVTGGADARDDLGTYRDTEIYDPALGAFQPGPNMRRERYKHDGTSLTLTDGRLLIAGGAAQAEIFSPTGGTFTLVGGDARMRGSFERDTLLPNGQVLITGGYGLGHGPTNSAWLFQP